LKTAFITILILQLSIYSQDETDKSAKYLSWALIQTIPSPVFFHDSDGKNGRLQFGLRWQLIPLNISFRPNKYISRVQFFMINPVRRFTGSIELFIQPEWAAAKYQFASINRFGIAAGSRIIIPLKGGGQNLSASIGGKYNYHKEISGGSNTYFGIESGIYIIYGVLGIHFNYNFNTNSKYNAGLFFKYF